MHPNVRKGIIYNCQDMEVNLSAHQQMNRLRGYGVCIQWNTT